MPPAWAACTGRVTERRPAPRGAGFAQGRGGPRSPRVARAAESLIPGTMPARGMGKWKECASEYTVALTRGATGSYSATVPAPVARELGLPARITFRRSGNRITVAPGGRGAPAAPAGSPAAGGGGATARQAKDKPPSEMSLETNILRYLANCLERRHDLAEGAVVPVSPTQPEEHVLGFDAAVGLSEGRYALLQFKRPAGRPGDGNARFEMDGRQALTLLQYPRGSAFYVLPPVRTNREMAEYGRCLLHRARIVDAWDVFAAVSRSRRAAGAAGAAAPGGGGCHGAGSGGGHVAYVDNGGRGAVRVRAGGDGGRPPYFRIHSKPASSLCHGADDVGFYVRDGHIVERHGATWDRGGWRAEAGRALGAPIGPAWRWRDGRWEADEGAGGGADDGPGRPGVEEAETRFRWACREGGAEGGAEGGNAYLLWLAGAPLHRAGP